MHCSETFGKYSFCDTHTPRKQNKKILNAMEKDSINCWKQCLWRRENCHFLFSLDYFLFFFFIFFASCVKYDEYNRPSEWLIVNIGCTSHTQSFTYLLTHSHIQRFIATILASVKQQNKGTLNDSH